MKKKFYEVLKERIQNNNELHIVTIVKANMESYIGKRILISEKQIIFNEVNNLEVQNSIFNNINFNECGKIHKIDNDIEIVIEHIISKPNLIICGGGHIALSLCDMGKMLDFNVTVIDDRYDFANSERFPKADNIICDSFTNALNNVNFNRNSYFVIVTRGHKADQECVEKILKNEFRYLGMIGSKAKVANSIRQLLEKGYTTEDINKLHSPIGISIGAKTPAEIAISIMAQIIEEKNNSNVSTVDEDILNSILYDNHNKVLVSILDKKGSSPRGVDAKMLVKSDGNFIGTIGGGAVENAAYEKALELIKERKSYVESYNLSNSIAATLGMVCGGTIKVLFEYIG